MTRFLLRLIPAEWRDSVARDLTEEAARSGRRGVAGDVWCAWQVLCVVLRFRVGRRNVIPAPRDVRRLIFGHLGADVRLAFRTLGRQPWPALAIVATLGVGIGATTATYTVFNHILFRPTPGVHDADRLVTVYFQPAGQAGTFGQGLRAALPALRVATAATLDGLADFSGSTIPIATAPGQEPVFAKFEHVASQYFSLLRVRPMVGRLIDDREADEPGHDVVVISERLWRRDYAGDPSVLGRSLLANGKPFTIVGVVDGYQGWGPTQQSDVDVWLPLGSADDTMFTLIGRLRPGGSVAVVEQQLRAAYERAAPSSKTGGPPYLPVVYAGLSSFQSARMHANIMQVYWVLMAGVAMLLLLACVNTANLLLARAIGRQQDTAVRQALGAARLRIVRQFFVESIVLAALAGACGLVLAELMSRAFAGARVLSSAPKLDGLELDSRVLLFCAGVTSATVFLFGLAPAVLASRLDLRGAVASLGRTTPSRHRLRATLACAQLAMSLALVASGAVLNRSLMRLTAVDLGMRIDRTIGVNLTPIRAGYDDAASRTIYLEAEMRLDEAGFRDVAFSSPGPLSTSLNMVDMQVDPASAARTRAAICMVSPEYFRVLGIPLLSGRPFDRGEYFETTDRAVTPMIANDSLAKLLFGTAPAVGRHITVHWLRSGPPSDVEIVGVVGDTKGSDVRADASPKLYNAHRPGFRFGTFVVTAQGTMSESISRIRSVFHAVAPGLPLTSIGPLSDDIAEALSTEGVLARLGLIVGALAAVLAASGVFAVVAFVVSERTREFGIRIALGSPRGAVARGVLQRTMIMAGAGIVAGLALYAWGSRWLVAKLFGVSAIDPLAILVAIVSLAAAAALAAWIPARRAAAVDPITALRAE